MIRRLKKDVLDLPRKVKIRKSILANDLSIKKIGEITKRCLDNKEDQLTFRKALLERI
jgi:hypothetical protein